MVLMRLFRRQSAVVRVMSVLYLPGVLVHELSHLLVGRALLVNTQRLTIVPKIEGERIILGSVMVPKTDLIRRFLMGAAPVYVGLTTILAIMWLAEHYHFFQSWLGWLIIGYAVFEVSNTLFTSRADMEGALTLFVGLAAVGALLYWAGLWPTFDWLPVMLTSLQPVFIQAVLWMCLSLGIDIVLLLLLRLMP